MHSRSSITRLLIVSVVVLITAGCSFSIGSKSVKASEVETKAEQALGAQVGTEPDITCPDDLKAEEGATVRCELRAPGDETNVYGVTVTAESVDGDNVSMNFKVDDEPLD